MGPAAPSIGPGLKPNECSLDWISLTSSRGNGAGSAVGGSLARAEAPSVFVTAAGGAVCTTAGSRLAGGDARAAATLDGGAVGGGADAFGGGAGAAVSTFGGGFGIGIGVPPSAYGMAPASPLYPLYGAPARYRPYYPYGW